MSCWAVNRNSFPNERRGLRGQPKGGRLSVAIPVQVPKLGNTVEECLIAKWLKKKGDLISANEPVVEIETDKTSFEVASPASGTLLDTFFEEGELVPVFTNLCVIGTPGESIDEFRPRSAGGTGDTAKPAEPSNSEELGRNDKRPANSPNAWSAGEPSGAMSPRARRFAEDHNFRPGGVTGSGPGGRVLEQDLRSLYYSSLRVSSAARARLESGAAAPPVGSGIGGMVLSSDLVAPALQISSVREKIARRMRASLANTAQYTLHASADARPLLLLRARIKASTGLPDININDMVTFCAVKALADVPDVNALFIDGKVHRSCEVRIGFACDTPKGLLVPVIGNAHALTVTELAQRMKELTAQAIQGKISADDLTGATFTVSNLGSLGIEWFTPLLNPPQLAIHGIGAIELKPVRIEGRVEFIDAIRLSLTLDHQIIDGAPGAKFLKVVREKIENVESLCSI